MTDGGDTSPEKIEQELLEEAQREMTRRGTGKPKQAADSNFPTNIPPPSSRTQALENLSPGDFSTRITTVVNPGASTVLPPQHEQAITSLYRIAHPGSPLSALVISGILIALAIVAGTGIAMGLGYAPSAEDAHSSVAWFSDGTIGAMLRAAHYHGTNVLIYLSAVYLIHLLWSGIFRRPGQWVWWRAVMFLLLVLGFGFTGQLLPGDQLAVHGTAIRLGYMSEVPVIGPQLRAWMQGGGDLGSAAFVRFFALHVMVLPALTLLLLRSLWRDGRPRERSNLSASAHALVMLVIAAAIIALTVVSAAPLGLGGSLSESYPEARPEWYALPLYQLLKILPPGMLHTFAIAVGPPLSLGFLLALPWLERVSAEPARLRGALRGLIIGSLVVLAAFGAWALYEDNSHNEGYFVRYDVSGLMGLIRTRNNSLNNKAEPLPDDAQRPARDLMLLAAQLRTTMPKDQNDQQQQRWRQWSQDLEAASRNLLEADSQDARAAARTRLREVCSNCHQAYEKKVSVEPRAKTPAATQPDKVIKPDPVETNVPFFDNAKAGTKTVSADLPKTRKIMGRMSSLCVDLDVLAGKAPSKQAKRDAEQCLVDLRAGLKSLSDIHPTFTKEGKDVPEDKWKELAAAASKALETLSGAKKGKDFDEKFAALGKSCDACHTASKVDWDFTKLLED